MSKKKIVEQLVSLKYSQECFDKGTEETEVFRKDIEALDYAIKCIETLFKLKDYIKDRNIQYELVGEDMLKIIEEVKEDE